MLPFHGLADHEPGHVGQEQQRNSERVAQPNEPRRLVGAIDEKDATLPLGLAGDDPHRLTIEAGEPRHDLAREQALDLEEAALVDQGVDDREHVERLVLVGG